jgi:glycerol-3-phosphate acyltransferase PlsY
VIVALLVGYVLGSLPSAVLIGKLRGIDPRESGDGNPGWWNARVLFGEWIALVVLAADLCKGALAVLAGQQIWGPWWTPYVALAGAMLGHAFPVFGDFRGGRGIPTFFGGMAILSPIAAAVGLALGVVVTARTHHLVHGARAAVLALPFVLVLLGEYDQALLSCLFLGFIGLRFLFEPAPGALLPPRATHPEPGIPS